MNWKHMNAVYIQAEMENSRECSDLGNKIIHLQRAIEHIAYCIGELVASRDKTKDYDKNV